MNKEAPIGADSFCDNESYCHIKIGTNWCLFIPSNCDPERYCHIKIGTNWCLFILTVMRDYVISKSVMSKSAPIGADLDMTISLRSTVRMNKEAPIGADLDIINCLTRAIRIKRLLSNQNRHQLVPLYSFCDER